MASTYYGCIYDDDGAKTNKLVLNKLVTIPFEFIGGMNLSAQSRATTNCGPGDFRCNFFGQNVKSVIVYPVSRHIARTIYDMEKIPEQNFNVTKFYPWAYHL